MASAIVGIAGVGKTEAILRALNCYPQQVIIHDTFPRLVGSHEQVVWQTVDIPASGKATDLAANLMLSWDITMAQALPDRPGRFGSTLAQKRRDGAQMLDEWRQVAMAHFLGVLHLDEVQNFFKLPRLEKRTKRAGRDGNLELSIVEDQCLKWVLTLTNTWQIPLVISGTPDGVEALGKRLSNIQRLASAGFHHLQPFAGDKADGAWQLFFSQLAKYQYVTQTLPANEELSNLVMELTAGVPRIIIALWIAAHRIAFERKDDDLRLADFRKAAATFLSPLAPAVAALRSNDPTRLSRYQDLLPGEEFWAQFWERQPETQNPSR